MFFAAKARRMKIEYDPEKNRRNIEARNLPLAAAITVLEAAIRIIEDKRRDYGEDRFITYGPIGDVLHVCVFTLRGEVRRVISLRRANKREVDACRAYVGR
jgi:uncharacterized DUF497 family protein